MRCQRYHGERLVKPGFDRVERQVYRCTRCGRRQTARSSSAFAGSRFPDEIIALAVRWSRCFRLSSVDLVDLLAERGIEDGHVIDGSVRTKRDTAAAFSSVKRPLTGVV